jgi:transcriptional regulator with XRE-family HTH domain
MKLENLKAIRKQKKLTRKELGELSGLNPSVINALENGYVDDIKLSTLIKLAAALKTKVRYLLPNDLKDKM